jgi:glutamyl/glutaminyl-tRNA synthetase
LLAAGHAYRCYCSQRTGGDAREGARRRPYPPL